MAVWNWVKDNSSFEFDSGTDSQKYVPKIKAQIGANSLLQTGTWAYLGSVKDAKKDICSGLP